MVKMDLVKNSVYLVLFLEVLIVNGGTKAPKTIYSPGMGLLQAERNFLKLLNEYKTNMESNVKKIAKYIEHYTSLYNSDETDYEEFLSNPINTYLLQRRLTLDVDDIVKERLWEPTKKLMDTVKSLQSTGELGHRDNISSPVDLLYNLQATYGLDSKALYEGYIKCSNYSNCPPKQYADKLTAMDAIFMTIKAVGSVDFNRASEWAELAAKKQPKDDLLMVKDGAIDQTIEAVDKIIGMVKMSMAMSITTGNAKLPNLKNETLERLQRLCRGEELQSLSEENELKCFHLDVDNPYYLMQPIRAEQLSEEPLVTMLHDIINHAEVETLKLLAKTNASIIMFNQKRMEVFFWEFLEDPIWFGSASKYGSGLQTFEKVIEAVHQQRHHSVFPSPSSQPAVILTARIAKA